jgi:hypothetical protein
MLSSIPWCNKLMCFTCEILLAESNIRETRLETDQCWMLNSNVRTKKVFFNDIRREHINVLATNAPAYCDKT